MFYCWLMKLSVRGEYALRALLVLGLNYDREVVPGLQAGRVPFGLSVFHEQPTASSLG